MALLLSGCGATQDGRPPLTFADLSAPGEMRTARVGSEVVAYHDAGEGTPVVLLHGLGEHAGYWRSNVEPLVAGGVRVVVPDLLGYGRSAKPARGDGVNPYGPGGQAARVAGLLDALGISEPVVLVGHSMGGQIATRFALAWPTRVRHLVLLAPAGVERFTVGEGAWLKSVSTPATFASRGPTALEAHFRDRVFGRWDAEAAHHLDERIRLRAAPAFGAYLRAVVAGIHGMLDEPVADELGELKVPVTALFGARDGLIPNPLLHGGSAADVAEAARAALPAGSRVALLPDVGHMLQTEAPDATHAAILAAAK